MGESSGWAGGVAKRAVAFQRVGCLVVPGLGALISGLAVGVVALWPHSDFALAVVFVALMLYAVMAPLLLLLARSVWLTGAATLLIGIVMFVALGTVAEAICKHPLGEGAMILLLPIMICPALVAVVSLIRLVEWVVLRTIKAVEGGGQAMP